MNRRKLYLILLGVLLVPQFHSPVVKEAFAISSLPDLVVDDIVFQPGPDYYANETVITVRVLWRNAGSAPTSGRCALDVSINGTSIRTRSTYTTINPGQVLDWLIVDNLILSQGTYIVNATADYFNDQVESNEGNNARNEIIDVLNPADVTPPPIPSLLSPANGASLTDDTPFLDWSDVSDPNGVKYDVQVSTQSTFSTISRSVSDLLGSGWTVVPNLPAQTYYWRVRAKDYVGNTSAWSSYRSFLIVAPSSPQWLVSPFDDHDGKYYLSWSPVVGATSYVLEEFDDISMVNPIWSVTTSSTSVYLTNRINKTYYYQLRALFGPTSSSNSLPLWVVVSYVPVVLVHGFQPCSTTTSWGNVEPVLEQPGAFDGDDGFVVEKIDYFLDEEDWSSSHRIEGIGVYAGLRLQSIRAMHNAPKVDVIAHSMGGLVIRSYIAELGPVNQGNPELRVPVVAYAGDVRKLVTLATPHFGTQYNGLRQLVLDALCKKVGSQPLDAEEIAREMVYGSRFVYDLNKYTESRLPYFNSIEVLTIVTGPLDIVVPLATSKGWSSVADEMKYFGGKSHSDPFPAPIDGALEDPDDDVYQLVTRFLKDDGTWNVYGEDVPSSSPMVQVRVQDQVSGRVIDAGVEISKPVFPYWEPLTTNNNISIYDGLAGYFVSHASPWGEGAGSRQYRAMAVGYQDVSGPVLLTSTAGTLLSLSMIPLVSGVAVYVSPGDCLVATGEQQGFAATVTGTPNQAVTWRVDQGSSHGTVDAAGLYTAPSAVPSPITATVRATSIADPTKSGTATVTINPSVSVSVTPATAAVTVSQPQQFGATVTGTPNQAVTWSVDQGSSHGTIDATGLYTAPGTAPSPSTATIRATSVADPGKSGTATVTITPEVSISVTPTTASVSVSQFKQFAAIVTGTPNQAVTWAVEEGVSYGTIDATGLYTAPGTVPSPSTATVRATSVADPTKGGTATVTITPSVLVSVSVTPATASVTVSQLKQFAATVTGTPNQLVTWTVDQGSEHGMIDATGLYTAPGTVPSPSTATVRATSVADPTKSGTATVAIAGGSAALLAYFPFNGNADDATGNGNNGTVHNAILTTDASGTPNSAYYFDGNGDYIEVGGSISLENRSFTISVLAQRDDVGDLGYLVTRGNSDLQNELMVMGFADNNKYVFGFSGNVTFTDGVFTDTAWHEWTFTHDKVTRERRLYQDGILVDAKIGTGDYVGAGPIFIGASLRPTIQTEFRGKIDEVRIYDGIVPPALSLPPILFESDRDGQLDVYAISPDGIGEIRMTSDPGNDGGATWSPDGTRIAFNSNRIASNNDIYIMNADGSGLVRLTTDPASDGGPDWHPILSQLVFTSTRSGSQEVYVMNADGTDVTRLTFSGSNGYPTWSPDGTRIAFISGTSLALINANGTGLTTLVSGGCGGHVSWYPDGEKICFSRNVSGNWDIYSYEVSSGAIVRLTTDPAADNGPEVSRDGGNVVFSSQRESSGILHLYIMNADGSGQARISSVASNFDGVPDWFPQGVSAVTDPPRWTDLSLRASPNPTKGVTVIQYDQNESGHVRLVVCDVVGRQITRLADEHLSVGKHQWEWDGRSDEGLQVPGGVYFALLTQGTQRKVSKILVVR